MRTNIFKITLLLVLLKFSVSTLAQNKNQEKEISHIFYMLGDIGEADNRTLVQQNLDALRNDIGLIKQPSTVIFLGNNVSSKGFKDTSNEFSRKLEFLDLQINTAKSLNINSIFIPGNQDWESGLKGLKSQEQYIEKRLGKGAFLPENGCPIKRKKINDDIDLIIIDSQWAIMDWNNLPEINRNCNIKTKTDFYIEFERILNKSEGKTVLVAMHHPIQSFGGYGSQFSFGVNPQKLGNAHYKEFSDRIRTIVRQTDKVIMVGGHDNNLQYFEEYLIPTIVSGAGGKSSSVKHIKEGFSSSDLGFVKIIQYTNGSVIVKFYGNSNQYSSSLFEKEIFAPTPYTAIENYHEYDSPQYVEKSIYEPEELERSGIYKKFWGEHYRPDYVTNIKVKTALLDTLYGGLTPIRQGGGHQTNSLRLKAKNGKQYTMRSTKKSAIRFLQGFLFKTQYLEKDMEDTVLVQLLQDYWTTANPYGGLTIADLSDVLDILHPNPQLLYIPKQKALGIYNENYGDKIYFIEERLSNNEDDLNKIGGAENILSTKELFKKLRKKEKIVIDERNYIRIRIFDNLIGDWDRHEDQWKWAEILDETGGTYFKAIPRDRDQVYSDFDGIMLKLLTILTPPLRFMQRYDEDYNAVRWYNDAGDDVDKSVLKSANRQDWIDEANFIRQHITEDVIQKAFANLPPEIDQDRVEKIKMALKSRLASIEENAIDMYENLSDQILITGTDKKDHFVIHRLPNGNTHVVGSWVKNKTNENVFWDATYNREHTKEIWLYGLGGEDTFEVTGTGNSPLHLKIIGGPGHDTYKISSRKNVKIYDHKTKKNTIEGKTSKFLSDNYDLNTYHFKKNKRDLINYIPLIGYNPDNGFGFGLLFNYTKNGLIRNPFTDKHQLGVNYYSETSGVNVSYIGEFSFFLDKVNLGIEANYSSPLFAQNFFGFGNNTVNLDDELDFDFNRVRIQKFQAAPSLILKGYQGSTIKIEVSYENIEVERTQGRFIAETAINENVFNPQNFVGTQVSYTYNNLKESIISENGISFGAKVGYKRNIDEDKGYAYIIPELGIATKLDKKGAFILASKAQSTVNFGDDFEFYQGATIGANNGLRGFRQQRFTGKRSLYHDTDLRLKFGNLRNGILPISFGAYGGFDYGRVWVDGENSNKWHTSYGGGLFFNLGNFTAFNLAYFSSTDGGRFNFGLNLPF